MKLFERVRDPYYGACLGGLLYLLSGVIAVVLTHSVEPSALYLLLAITFTGLISGFAWSTFCKAITPSMNLFEA